MKETRLILSAYEKARARGEACALATVVKVEGSSYRKPGARMLVMSNGEIFGSVSGGCLERDLIQRAHRCMNDGKDSLVRYDVTDEGDELQDFTSAALGCNGVIEIWLEPVFPEKTEHANLGLLREGLVHRRTVEIQTHGLTEQVVPPTPLLIFGAGQGAIPLIEIASTLGWEITVVDCHSNYSLPQRFFQRADRKVQCSAEQVSQVVPLTDDAVAVLMTHNYYHDLEILKQLAESPVRYIGMLGARKRSAMLLAELASVRKAPLPVELEKKIHCPVGLNLGGSSPQEIALSIAAEIQSVLTGVDVKPLGSSLPTLGTDFESTRLNSTWGPS